MSRVGKTREHLKRCLCAKCPTYVENAKVQPGLSPPPHPEAQDPAALGRIEFAYCMFGKSHLMETRKGCACFRCKVFQECGLNDGLFCVREEL